MNKTFASVMVALSFPVFVSAQFSLTKVTSLGKLKARHMAYYPDDKEWMLSDGYRVFKTAADFKHPALLFNTYPKYQFQLEKLPNKNLYCRHFDTKSPPYGMEPRTNKIDSSYIYVKGNGYKPVTGVLPNAFVKGRILNDQSRLRTWAISNCFIWGKDSTVFCREGVVGVMKVINGQDSIFNVYSNSTFTAFEASAQGDFIVAGTKDSGWFFIPSATPHRYTHIVPGSGLEIGGFYFDEMRKQLWVQETHSWKGFQNLLQYDYSGPVPKLVNSINHESLGLGENEDPIFAFDFNQNKVYVKSVITQLVLFDLAKQTIEAQLSWPGSQLSSINQVYFNKADNQLYLSAEKFDPQNEGDSNFIFRLEKDSLLFSNVIVPKNAIGPHNLYPEGMHTAVNKLPAGSFTGIKANISLAKDLALIPNTRSEYLLYNARSGNMIHSFRGANADLQISSRFVEENTASLSPDGRYIFQWLIKAGITHGISDTLQVALSNLSSGEIKRNTFLLTGKDDQQILDLAWDEQSRPLFTRISSTTYPGKNIKLFYLDSLLQPQDLADHKILKPDVIYDAWNVTGTPSVLISTGKPGPGKTYHYQLLKKDAAEPVTIRSSAANIDVLLNTVGLLFIEDDGANKLLAWYNKDGALLHTTTLNIATYRIQSLAKHSHHVYLTDSRTDGAARLDLATGKIIALQSKSKTGYSFAVSPAEDLIFSVSDKMEAWQLTGDVMHKLYELQTTKDFVERSQVSDKHLVSDGRIWNFETGQLSHAGLSSIAILNNSTYLATAYNYEVVQNLGFDENYNTTYGLSAHKQLFSKSLSVAKDLRKWYDDFDNILLVSRSFSDNALQNIYELPLKKEALLEVKLYTAAALNSVLIVKSPSAIYSNDRANDADTILLLNLATGKLDEKLVGKLLNIKQTSAGGAYLFYLLNQKTKTLQMYKTGPDHITKINQQVKQTTDAEWQTNIADENHVVYAVNEGIVFKNLQTGTTEQVRYTYLSGNYTDRISLHYEPDAKVLYVAYSDGGILKIVNNKVAAAVKSMPSAQSIVGINGKYLVALDKLGNYYFLDKNTLETALTLFTWAGNSFADRKYMWLTKENYYMATPGVEKNIHFVNKNQIIPLKQGDLQYNRPDKVLGYLGAAQTEVDFYKEVHQVRLNKYKGMKAGDAAASSDIQLKVSSTPGSRKIILSVDALAKNNLSRLNVMVNGCPEIIKPIAQKTNRLSQTIEVHLNAGDNTIFTWVDDEAGFSSAYNEQKFVGEFADSGKWHFVGIGVSHYKDSAQNLKYADKDIRDIAKFLARQYPGITIDTLLNEQVTKANMDALAARLKMTAVDDKIMVSFSGHGVLDKDKKFWFATHDVDFAAPALAGFSMSNITALLQNIPARYRMITLDACHSGDVVEGSGSKPSRTEILPEPMKETGAKGNILLGVPPHKDASKLLKSMQMVFTDQLSNTGINLVAASSGTEFALEGKQWNNGVFTYALLNGWSFGARENSSYNQVHYRGLKQYLQQKVSEITNGRQTPNTVMENGEINWWLIPANN